jgi:hypothetical protein
MMTPGHLSDDRLIEVCLFGGGNDAASHAEQQHLTGCARCDARRVRLQQLLDETSDTAAVAADAAFPAERLARQHARILAHLQHEGRPARVIAFPAGHTPQETVVSRTRPGSRWIAAAAVAGLVVGVIAGRFGHDYPFSSPASRVIVARTAEQAELRAAGNAPTIREVTASISDEELLNQLEMAIDAPAAAALQPIDDLTPLAWEVR